MPIDIRFPNGYVLANVPDGMTREQAMSRVKQTDFELYKELIDSLRMVDAPAELEGELPVRVPGTDIGFDVPVPESAQAMMIGAGRAADRVGATLESLVGGDATEARVAEEQAEAKRLYDPLAKEYPVSTMAGEILPAMAVPMGAVGGLAGKAATSLGSKGMGAALKGPIADAALTGSLIGGLDYEGSAQAGALGGAAGGVIGKGIGRALRPVRSEVNRSTQRAADLAKKSGYTLPPGELTGSDALRKTEASLRSSPFAAGAFQKIDEANQKLINQKAAKAIGETADEVTDEVLGRAHSRISRTFKRVAKNAKPLHGNSEAHDKLVYRVFEVLDEAVDDPIEVKSLLKLLERPSVSGPDLLQESVLLGKRATGLMRGTDRQGNYRKAQALRAIKEAVDDALVSASPRGARERLQEARHQFKNLMRLYAPGVIRSPTRGDVSAATLGNVLRNRDKHNFMRGRGKGDLFDAARIGKAFPAFPDSFTASRSALPMALGTSGLLAGQQLSQGDPEGALLGGALPIAALALSGRAMTHPAAAKYLSSGLGPLGREPVRRAITDVLGRGGAAIGATQ